MTRRLSLYLSFLFVLTACPLKEDKKPTTPTTPQEGKGVKGVFMMQDWEGLGASKFIVAAFGASGTQNAIRKFSGQAEIDLARGGEVCKFVESEAEASRSRAAGLFSAGRVYFGLVGQDLSELTEDEDHIYSRNLDEIASGTYQVQVSGSAKVPDFKVSGWMMPDPLSDLSVNTSGIESAFPLIHISEGSQLEWKATGDSAQKTAVYIKLVAKKDNRLQTLVCGIRESDLGKTGENTVQWKIPSAQFSKFKPTDVAALEIYRIFAAHAEGDALSVDFESLRGWRTRTTLEN